MRFACELITGFKLQPLKLRARAAPQPSTGNPATTGKRGAERCALLLGNAISMRQYHKHARRRDQILRWYCK